MLVLTRKENEAIMIGDDIQIMVTSIRGNSVALGIEAPKSVKIYRWEIYEKKKDEAE